VAGVYPGVDKRLATHLAGCLEVMLNPASMVSDYVGLLLTIPRLPALIEHYTDEFCHELDDEQRAEQLGKLITEAVLLALPSKKKITNLAAVKHKLGKAAGKLSEKGLVIEAGGCVQWSHGPGKYSKLPFKLGKPILKLGRQCILGSIFVC
jgi:hypothetical protein